MRILLIQPPIQDFYETDIRLQPIGLCYLKAAILNRFPDSEVILRDYHQGWGRKTIPIPKELSYLRPYYAAWDKSPFSTFFHYCFSVFQWIRTTSGKYFFSPYMF